MAVIPFPVIDVNYGVSMANVDADPVSTSDIQAVARVGQICQLFGPMVTELTAADMAERTGLNRTTAYRYCASMVAAGILERGSRRGTFTLGRLMVELGINALGRQRVVDIARPYLERLSTSVRLTAVLSIMGTQGPVVALVEEDTSRVVVVTVHAGTRLDPTAAQTHLFLAYGDPSLTETIARGLSPVERARLHEDVARARQVGFSVVRQDDGVFAAGAPVFDDHGLCATVAVLGAGTLDERQVLEQLTTTAARMSDELCAPRSAHAHV